MLQSNPAYIKVFSYDRYSFYLDSADQELHASRYVEALRWNDYANAGITDTLLDQLMDEVLLRCNTTMEAKTFKTDIAAIALNVKYRLKYPVDQHCAIRMGCILTYMEYEHEGKVIAEDPTKASTFWLEKKMSLALEVPEVYDFFINTGINALPKYKELWPSLAPTSYFVNRDQMINSLSPQPLTKG